VTVVVALADVNYNFKGVVTSAQLPLLFGIGAQYACIGKDALKVTAGGSGTRAITIATAPQGVWGDGVLSIWNSATNLNVAVVSSGTRYDTLVVRRTWQPASSPTGTAQLMLLTGGSSKAIAASRTTNRGVTTSDQPIALIRCSAGQTTITDADITDLRCWAGQGGGLVAESVEALQYLGDKGTSVRIDDYRHTRIEDALSGTLLWSVSLEAIPLAGARFIRARRGVNDDFPSGEAALLAASGASMPAGLYLISAAWHMRAVAGTGTAALRAAVSGSASWTEQVDLTTAIGIYGLTVPYEHPGGTLTVTLYASMAPGLSGRVTEGTQVTAMWVGPT
jgi:hypothetical protein